MTNLNNEKIMDNKPDEQSPGTDRTREAILATVVVLIIAALAVPIAIHYRRALACQQAAREFIENLRHARSTSGEIEGYSVIKFSPDGTGYQIEFKPGMTRSFQVSRFFMGTLAKVTDGEHLVFFVEKVDTGRTDVYSEIDHQQNRYYSVNFTNGRTSYQVRVYEGGNTKLVKIH